MDCLPCIRLPPSLTVGTDIGILESFIKHYYTPWLLSSKVKRAVLSGFSVSFLVTLFLSQLVEFGMDQRLALPRNSYLIDYFNDMESYLGVGPPVYFVTRDVNLTDASNQRAICGRFSGCELKSMTVQLEQERKRPTLSFIAEPTASWLDDFFLWLDPAVTSCCRVKKTKKPEQVLHLSSPLVSPPPPPHFCSDADDEDSCESCFASRPWNSSLVGLPQGPEFIAYLQRFISSIPSEECPLGGKAAYESAVSIDESFLFVNSSSFRTFHTPLKTQRDYIGAYLQARRIAQEITQESGVPVFPYSVFYVFFSQYATIFQLTTFIVVSACVAIFGISWILLSSLVSAALILIVVAMILVNLLGVMGVWGVSLNAVSTVNLGIAVGISVEYLSHLTRAFMVSPGFSRDERVAKAMADVGSSVSSETFSSYNPLL